MEFEVGILFDIDHLGGGFYGWEAYKILFRALDPNRLGGCTLLDGDTAATLAHRANHYCIAIQSLDPAPIQYVRETLGRSQEKGLLPSANRFLEGVGGQPLVLAGIVDAHGNLVVKEGSMIGSGWTEGTAWSIVKR